MKEKDNTYNHLISLILIVIMLLVTLYIMYNTTTNDYFDKEYIIVEGVATEIIPCIDDDGSIEYLHVYFDTGEQYRIKPTGILHNSIDFTVNSKLIVELYWYPNQGEDFKYIGRIIKVPDIVDGDK